MTPWTPDGDGGWDRFHDDELTDLAASVVRVEQLMEHRSKYRVLVWPMPTTGDMDFVEERIEIIGSVEDGRRDADAILWKYGRTVLP